MRLAPLLGIWFNSFLIHGFLPDTMISVLLVPVIKDKSGKVGYSDNYRPIALASVLSKVFESILLSRIVDIIPSTDNQFCFKSKHGTDMAIYSLKEIVNTYRDKNSSVLMSFIDASKAFDRVNHYKLFDKMSKRGVSKCIVRILSYWYANQSIAAKWGHCVSAPFGVRNGVRQGGILSPILFNMYVDELSVCLNSCNTGCMIGNTLVNHIMYALLNVCSDYGTVYDMKFNTDKSAVMICRTKEDKCLMFPPFKLAGNTLRVLSRYKYLGHLITDQLKDDLDVYRQCRSLYAQANSLARKFGGCTDRVKVALFRAYCTPLHNAHLWSSFSKASLHKLQVAYNDALRILLRRPRWCSASEMFVAAGVNTLQATLRNVMYKCICRLNNSENYIIMALTSIKFSTTRYKSKLWKHWYSCLL
ncbi:hypothetical protein PO909_022775 [Leuciscus waleckii]